MPNLAVSATPTWAFRQPQLGRVGNPNLGVSATWAFRQLGCFALSPLSPSLLSSSLSLFLIHLMPGEEEREGERERGRKRKREKEEERVG